MTFESYQEFEQSQQACLIEWQIITQLKIDL